MPTPNTRITSSGTYLVNGNFDEVTGVIISNGLVVYLDAGRIASNASSTATWVDVVGGYVSTLTNVTYSNTGGGSIYFTNNSTQAATLYSLTGTFWSSTTWTVSVWANMSFLQAQKSGSTDNAFLSHGAASPDQGLHLGERGGIVYFGFYADDLGGVTTLSTGTWNNIVWQYNPTTRVKNIYVNGRLDRTATASGYYTATNANTEIGRYTWSTSQVLYGYMGQVAIYNRTLSPLEILKNYQTFLGRYSTTGTYTRSSVTPGTVYYDQLDEVTYNPNNGVASNNLFSYSTDLQAGWGATNLTKNNYAGIGPDGTLTATKVVEATTTSYKELSQGSIVITTGTAYTVSIYAKAAERSSFRIGLTTEIFGASTNIYFNLATGTITSYSGGYSLGSIISAGNGWYRCSGTFTPTITTTTNLAAYFTLTNPSEGYLGDGVSGLYYWGAQLEKNNSSTIFVATTGSVAKFTNFAQRTDNQGTAYVANYFDEVTGMINTNGLILNVNPASPASYPGSGTVWKDIATDNNATSFNSPTFYSNSGTFYVPSGAYFGGFPQSISQGGSSRTVGIWLNSASSARGTPIETREVGGLNLNGWNISINRTTATNLTYFHTGGSALEIQNMINTNQWYYVVATFNTATTTANVYLNGVLVGSQGSFSPDNVSTSTGNICYGGGSFAAFTGQLGMTHIYNRVLSATEILDNFNSTRSQYGV